MNFSDIQIDIPETQAFQLAFYEITLNTLAGNIGLCNSNWYSNNVRALTIEMDALQLDQLSEQTLFLFDCVWCTLQSNDTNFSVRFEL